MLGLTLEWERYLDGVEFVAWTEEEWREELDAKMRRLGYRHWILGEAENGKLRNPIDALPAKVIEVAREWTDEWAQEAAISKDSDHYRYELEIRAIRVYAKQYDKYSEDTPAEHIEWANKERGRMYRDPEPPRYKARTDRRVPITFNVSDLEDPIIVHFANAKSIEDKTRFFSRFGFLHSSDRHSMLEKRADEAFGSIRDLLASAGSHDRTLAVRSVNEFLETLHLHTPRGPVRHIFPYTVMPALEFTPDSGRPRLALRPKNLFALMVMEATLIAANDVLLASCEHCGKFFLTGPLTGRRSHAKFCSDRCRVAAMRKRNAENALKEE